MSNNYICIVIKATLVLRVLKHSTMMSLIQENRHFPYELTMSSLSIGFCIFVI
mgnify:CR=1